MGVSASSSFPVALETAYPTSLLCVHVAGSALTLRHGVVSLEGWDDWFATVIVVPNSM